MQKGTVKKLIEYFFKNHSHEMIFAMRDFFGENNIGPGGNINIQNNQEEGLFMEWIVFDYRFQNGKGLLDNFISENPLDMSKSELRIYEDLQINKYGFFEIISVKKDEYLELESLQSGKIYKVQEKMGTYNAEPKTTLVCRVGKVADHWELIGSDPVGFPIHYTERAKKLMREDKGKYSPKDIRKLLIDKKNNPSKFEKNLRMKDEDFIKKQNQIRTSLEKQLIKSKSTASVDDILKIVYREKRHDDISKIVSLLGNNKNVIMQSLLDLASSAWNYFPHKSLGGKSPAEKAKEIYGDQKKI
ncbi:MAG: hypothetical protein NTZ65_00935 [Candidatus Berkelbacteria bacterium]|nr:hypothetical protein [Candidatus Berkelbacteria bacterium]